MNGDDKATSQWRRVPPCDHVLWPDDWPEIYHNWLLHAIGGKLKIVRKKSPGRVD